MKNWKEITKLELQKYFDDGLWYEEIAEIYNISHRAVRDKTKKFEMNIPRKNLKKEVKIKTCSVCGKEYKQSKNEGFCSSNCKTSKLLLSTQNLDDSKANTELGKNILKLRTLGKTYNEISKELNCSKSTVARYCNDTTKNKRKEYVENNKEYVNFLRQITNFKRREMNTNKISMCADWNKKFRTACSYFRTRNKMELENNFTYHDAIDHLGGEITKCYLTGRKIDITKDDFTLDHIIPVSLGGSCELDNMGITIPEANSMKSNIMLDDFFNLCKEILEFNGYEVNKIK